MALPTEFYPDKSWISPQVQLEKLLKINQTKRRDGFVNIIVRSLGSINLEIENIIYEKSWNTSQK